MPQDVSTGGVVGSPVRHSNMKCTVRGGVGFSPSSNVKASPSESMVSATVPKIAGSVAVHPFGQLPMPIRSPPLITRRSAMMLIGFGLPSSREIEWMMGDRARNGSVGGKSTWMTEPPTQR